MSHLTFLTGPVRSGKSRRAVELARTWGDDVVFVATYRTDPADAEMTHRLARHRAERPPWRTLEAPIDILASLAGIRPVPAGVVVDCLTLWLSDRLEAPDEVVLAEWERQLAGFKAGPWPVVIVGNEVGWCPVPESAGLRRFRDLAGSLGQLTARAADAAFLHVAGCPVRLKGN